MIWNEIQFFRPAEFACKCGRCKSDGTEMSLDVVNKLDQLRERMKIPLRVTSGYRCPDYNAQVSTTGRNGPHTTGRAADIAVAGPDAFRLVRHCTLGGWFTGIGVHQRGDHAKRFIHLDDLDGDGRPWIWTY